MVNSDRISIIVPVYNGEKYIEQTLNQLRQVTYQNIEIVLIDDGSKDTSFRICEEIASIDNRIRLYHQENQGIVAARNTGLRYATGDYICFCDQDDIVKADTYEIMYNRIKSENAGMCLCSTGKYANGTENPYEMYEDATLDKDEIVKRIALPIIFDGYRLNYGNATQQRVIGTIWKCMISKSLIEKENVKFKRFINYEDDLLFLLDCLCGCDKVVTVSHMGYLWRVNTASETFRWKYIEMFYEKQMEYYLYLKKILEKLLVNEMVKKEFKRFFWCNIITETIDNEGSPQNERSYRSRIKYLKQIIFSQEYEDIIAGEKNIKWGLLRKKVILILVKNRMIQAAYWFNVLYRNVKKRAVHLRFWNYLEKKVNG